MGQNLVLAWALQQHSAALTGAAWCAVHDGSDLDRAVQPQAVSGPVGGAHLPVQPGLHHHVVAEHHGLQLDLAGLCGGQGEQLDASHRYVTM